MSSSTAIRIQVIKNAFPKRGFTFLKKKKWHDAFPDLIVDDKKYYYKNIKLRE